MVVLNKNWGQELKFPRKSRSSVWDREYQGFQEKHGLELGKKENLHFDIVSEYYSEELCVI